MEEIVKLESVTAYNKMHGVDKHSKTLIASNIELFKSISEVAYELGFKYPQHFTRVFKQRTGMSPNDYRNLN